MNEEWKPIPGYEGSYEISNLGRARSLDRVVECLSSAGAPQVRKFKGKVLSTGAERTKYEVVVLSRPEGKISRHLHRLVYEAFVGEIPEGMHIDHTNRNTRDNRVSNLRICTPSQNQRNRCSDKNTSSKYRGVYKSRHGRWVAACKSKDGVVTYLGTYTKEDSAAAAYDEYGKKHFSEFFNPNLK